MEVSVQLHAPAALPRGDIPILYNLRGQKAYRNSVEANICKISAGKFMNPISGLIFLLHSKHLLVSRIKARQEYISIHLE
jgi:hypothetical protein